MSIMDQSEERYFVSREVPGVHYLLPSDQKEKERLDSQHWVITQAFDGKIVFAPCDFSRGLSVLDAGVGSGAWVLDAAQRLPPSTKFHGIDIQSRLFPSIRPDDRERIQFSIESVSDLPDKWSNSFDLVNQRLLMGALQRPQWEADISGIYRVLKPGGWIQLCEFGCWVGGGPVSRQFDEAQSRLFAAKGLLRDCLPQYLPQLLTEARFVDIHVEERTTPFGTWGGRAGVENSNNSMLFFGAVRAAILKEGLVDFARTDAEYDAHLQKLMQEWEELPGAGCQVMLIYAHKAE